ncbi:PAS domain S-box protein [uncultured Methanospirillum sp.]|uniref:PAS domain S-box protein n=1 Tax=uncultured Methanospirillum sp. TaxID=262503 RepID=UPI0029C62B6B|nr:PAS domain S-box protein [uncultured Methanospirillum sp.]
MRSYFLNRKSEIVRFILVTIIYFIFAKISLTFGITHGNVSPLWIPAGIAVAVMVRWGYPVTPGIWLGTFLVVLTTGLSPVAAALLGIGNCAEAVIFLVLFRQYQTESFSLSNPLHTFRLCAIITISCLFASLFGALSLYFLGYLPIEALVLNIFTWWLGDFSGIILIAPLLITPHLFIHPFIPKGKWIELVGYFIILIPASYLMFQMGVSYLFLIFIMYAVFRFSFFFVFLTLIIGDVFAFIPAITTSSGSSFSPLDLLSIQLFISITALVALFLNAVVEGRLQALLDLQTFISTQDETIRERTRDLKESEKRFHELFSNMHAGMAIYQAVNDGEDFLISDINHAVERIEGVVKEDIIGHSILEVFPGVKDLGLFDVLKEVWKTGVAKQFPVSFYVDEKRSGWRDNFVYKLQNGDVVAMYDDVTRQKEAEESLNDTQEWLQLTQRAAKAGSWDWDMRSSVQTWNPEFYSLFALPDTAEPTFETLITIIHPDDRKPALDRSNKAIKEKIDLWNEFRIRLPDGRYRWIGAAGKTMYDDEGVAVRMSGICLDITKIKEAEEALQKSEERLKYTMEAIDDGYWDWDIPSGQTHFNPRLYTMLGYEPYELPQSYDTFISLLHPDDHERLNTAISDHFHRTQIPYSIEFRLRKKSGEYLWILSRGKVVVWNDDQKPVRMVGTHTDISHRKEVEDELRESEQRYRLLIDNVPDIILVHQAGIIQYVNPAAIQRMGYTQEELIKTSITQYIAPEYRETITMALLKRMEGLEIDPYEIEILMKSGERRNVVVRGISITYLGTLSSLNVLTDITEQKKIEKSLRNFNEKLEAEVQRRTEELNKSLREKEVLLKEIHHRVKNNMQVVSSLLFMQARNVKEPEIRNILLESQNRIRSIALVHEELYQSRDFEQIEYSDYLKKISGHIFETFQVNQNQITLEISSDQVYMPIDKAVPCSLVVNELFSNSLKYSFPNGRAGWIRVSLSRDENYTLVFEDNGIGIPEEITFDTAKTLGFHLIKGLVAQLNGTIHLHRDNGTQYVITFPS